MNIREALIRATGQLSAHPTLRDSALADATLLLMETLAIDRTTLIAHPDRTLDREDQARYQRLLERRLRFEPIQYIRGQQEFYGLRLHVSPAVLIPRPETELLVEATLSRLPQDVPLRLIDVGTGSGAIAIALAHHLPQLSVTAIDLSPDALDVARQNAVAHGLDRRIRFVESNLLAALAQDEPCDAIVSNPPYIAAADAPTLHPQVRDHEPSQALFSGLTGLELYERLIPQSSALLRPNGLLALEIGHGQRDAIAALLRGWREVEFLSDLQQIPRVALARRP